MKGGDGEGWMREERFVGGTVSGGVEERRGGGRVRKGRGKEVERWGKIEQMLRGF